MISVLYVDDESALLEVTKIFMERGGEFSVDTATSAKEALGKLKAARFDALVSDYQMPEMDGIELLKYLRPRCRGMPFILFTGKGGEDTAIEALNAGADFYIQKGGSPRAQFAELETKIRSAVARRQSELALRHSEEEYRTLVENLNGIVCGISGDGTITYISPRIEGFGYDPKEVTGKDFSLLVCAEDIPSVARHLAEVKTGITVPFDFGILDRTGRCRRVQASCRAQTDGSGTSVILGFLTEIPDETTGEGNLKEKEHFHRLLLDTAAVGVIALDPETGIPVDYNNEACRILGYTRDEFAQSRLADWEAPDGPQKLSVIIPYITANESAVFETRFFTKAGSVRDIRGTVRGTHDGVQKWLGITFRDVSEETDAGQRLAKKAAGYKKLYEGIPVACLILSPEGTIRGVNRAGEVFLSSARETLAGKSLRDFIAEPERPAFETALAELAQSGSIHGRVFAFMVAGKPAGSCILDAIAARNQEGTLDHFSLTLADISPVVAEREALRTAAVSAQAIIGGARDGIIACTPDLLISEWNDAMADITGIPPQDARGKLLGEMLPFSDTASPGSPPRRALAGEIAVVPDTWYEYPKTRRDGWCRVVFSPVRDTNGSICGIAGVVQEITARLRSVQRIRAANRLYAISESIRAAAEQTRQLETLLEETCRIAAGADAISMAWIGLYDQGAGILRPVASAGDMDELPKGGYRIAEPDDDAGPVGDAIRRGTPVVCPDIAGDPSCGQPWSAALLRHSCRSLAAVPFRLNGEVVGVLTLGSKEPAAFMDTEGEQLGLLGTTLSLALDFLDKKTLQRRTGKGSRGSWERTRFLAEGLETASVPFAAICPDGTTAAVNAALCRFTGYTEEELLARPFSGLFADPHEATERFREILASQAVGRYETSLSNTSGKQVPVEVFLQTMTDETGGGLCVSAYVADRSAQVQQLGDLTRECQLYRTLYESCPVPVLLTTAGGSIRAANPAACELFGQKPADLCLMPEGRSTGTGDPRFVELIRDCNERGNSQGVLCLARADGSMFDVFATIARYGVHGEEPVYTLALAEIDRNQQAGAVTAQDRDPVLTFLDTLPFPARRILPQERGIFCNRAWLAFTGRTADEEGSDGWMADIHPDDRYPYGTAYAGTGGTGPAHADYRMRSADGTYRWIREIRCPDPDSDGAEGGITFLCCDIDERMKAQRELEGAKAQYMAVFEQTNQAVFLLKGDHITGCNPTAARLLGLPLAEIPGHTLGEYLLPDLPKGDTPSLPLQDYLAAAGRGEIPVFSRVLVRPDKTTRNISITLAAVSLEGDDLACALIEDHAEQTRAEQEIARLAAFPGMNPSPVLEMQPDRTITYANPATTSVLASLGLSVDPSVFLPADIDLMVKTIDPAHPLRTCRVVQLRERWFQETICAVPGQPVIRIYAYDITDRVHAMEALAYANHKLGILTSITRHDIQNKLSGVFGYLDLLRSSLRDQQLIEYLDKAESSADAIRRHIEFTRDYESLGGTAPVWQEIQPILADVRSHFDLAGIAFEEPAPGFAVFADPMFAKVLYNLVDNSLRHGVHVRHIRVQRRPADTGCILTYEDDGVGIPQDKKELVFERGFTTSSGSSRTSGLGLFLVRDILAITGITIRETGVAGEGSRFEIAIPPGKWRTGPAP